MTAIFVRSGRDPSFQKNAFAQRARLKDPGLRQIEHAPRDRELAALISSEDAQLNTDIRVGPNHRVDCLGVEAIRLARAEMFEHPASIHFRYRAVPYCWESSAAHQQPCPLLLMCCGKIPAVAPQSPRLASHTRSLADIGTAR